MQQLPGTEALPDRHRMEPIHEDALTRLQICMHQSIISLQQLTGSVLTSTPPLGTQDLPGQILSDTSGAMQTLQDSLKEARHLVTALESKPDLTSLDSRFQQLVKQNHDLRTQLQHLEKEASDTLINIQSSTIQVYNAITK